eukprot:Rhum_TRINITY_DN14529_c11_g1::Rhum_TRINITY_DN14529_c11_g1_i1::g.96887::m.96887
MPTSRASPRHATLHSRRHGCRLHSGRRRGRNGGRSRGNNRVGPKQGHGALTAARQGAANLKQHAPRSHEHHPLPHDRQHNVQRARRGHEGDEDGRRSGHHPGGRGHAALHKAGRLLEAARLLHAEQLHPQGQDNRGEGTGKGQKEEKHEIGAGRGCHLGDDVAVAHAAQLAEGVVEQQPGEDGARLLRHGRTLRRAQTPRQDPVQAHHAEPQRLLLPHRVRRVRAADDACPEGQHGVQQRQAVQLEHLARHSHADARSRQRVGKVAEAVAELVHERRQPRRPQREQRRVAAHGEQKAPQPEGRGVLPRGGGGRRRAAAAACTALLEALLPAALLHVLALHVGAAETLEAGELGAAAGGTLACVRGPGRAGGCEAAAAGAGAAAAVALGAGGGRAAVGEAAGGGGGGDNAEVRHFCVCVCVCVCDFFFLGSNQG